MRQVRQNNPTGNSLPIYGIVSSPKIKNISLLQNREWWHIYRHPVPARGASAIVTNVGRGAVDAEVPLDERH
jgi:hypothetical protein